MAYKEANVIPPSSETGYVTRTSFDSEAGVSSLCPHCKETSRHWEVWFIMALISYPLSKHTKKACLWLYHINGGISTNGLLGEAEHEYSTGNTHRWNRCVMVLCSCLLHNQIMSSPKHPHDKWFNRQYKLRSPGGVTCGYRHPTSQLWGSSLYSIHYR